MTLLLQYSTLFIPSLTLNSRASSEFYFVSLVRKIFGTVLYCTHCNTSILVSENYSAKCTRMQPKVGASCMMSTDLPHCCNFLQSSGSTIDRIQAQLTSTKALSFQRGSCHDHISDYSVTLSIAYPTSYLIVVPVSGSLSTSHVARIHIVVVDASDTNTNQNVLLLSRFIKVERERKRERWRIASLIASDSLAYSNKAFKH